MFESPGLLGRPHRDPRRQGLLALAGRLDADASAWRRRLLRERWRRQRGEEKARERYRKGLFGAFDTGDAEGLLSGAARGSSEAVTAPPGGAGFDLGNIGRGIGERAGDLGGGLLGAVNAAAGYLERQVPLGGIDLERGGLYSPDAPPERNLGRVAARRLRHLDLGYAAGTSWEEVKRSPAAKAIPFALEQGLVSLPDMAAALASLPAYVLARTGDLAGARADADLRAEATVGDLVAALPGAAASALLERLGARGMLGIGDALKARSVRGVAGAAGRGSAKEGGTETGQEGIEHLTARLGTATGIDGHEMADAMMAGGAAGAIFGGGVRGATATGEALLGRPQARKAGAGAPPAPSAPSAPALAEPRGTPVPVSARGGDRRAPPTEPAITPVRPDAVDMSEPGGRWVVRPTLDRSRDVPVVGAVSRFSRLPTINVMRRAARQYVRALRARLRLRPPINRDIGIPIILSVEGSEKIVSGYRTPDEFDVLTALPGLIEESIHVEATPDRDARSNVRAMHSFYGAARVGERLLRVLLVVKEDNNGNFIYDTHAVDIESPDVVAAGSPAIADGQPITGPSRPMVRLGTLLAGVNYEDGTPVFRALGEHPDGGDAPRGPQTGAPGP